MWEAKPHCTVPGCSPAARDLGGCRWERPGRIWALHPVGKCGRRTDPAAVALLRLLSFAAGLEQPERLQLHPAAQTHTAVKEQRNVVWLLFLWVMSHPDFVYWTKSCARFCAGVCVCVPAHAHREAIKWKSRRPFPLRALPLFFLLPFFPFPLIPRPAARLASPLESPAFW